MRTTVSNTREQNSLILDPFSYLLQVSLAKWENERENERRRLLMLEAELKQQSGMETTVSKYRNKLLEIWMSR